MQLNLFIASVSEIGSVHLIVSKAERGFQDIFVSK